MNLEGFFGHGKVLSSEGKIYELKSQYFRPPSFC